MTETRGPLPVMQRQCPTCPFREDGRGYTEVRGLLMQRALNEATPICHSTGDSGVVEREIHKEPHACRGARDLQLAFFAATGFIEAPADAAWAKKVKEMGL